jgi:hypothetical protein
MSNTTGNDRITTNQAIRPAAAKSLTTIASVNPDLLAFFKS